jgi:hypothetical protein
MPFPQEEENKMGTCLNCSKRIYLIRDQENPLRNRSRLTPEEKEQALKDWKDRRRKPRRLSDAVDSSPTKRKAASTLKTIAWVLTFLFAALAFFAAYISTNREETSAAFWLIIAAVFAIFSLPCLCVAGWGRFVFLSEPNKQHDNESSKQLAPNLHTKKLGFFGWCIVIFASLWLFGFIADKNGLFPDDPKMDAYIAAKKFTMQHYPGAKSFSSYDHTLVTVNSGVYTVTLMVDGVNSFNSPIRNEVIVLETANGKTWSLISIDQQ